MILILCIDEKGGMAFNSRRQSRDRLQRKHLLAQVKDAPLYMSPYTWKLLETQFPDKPDHFHVSNEYREKAFEKNKSAKKVFLWCERDAVDDLLPKVDEIRIYRWNRLYPSDVRFKPASLEGFRLVKMEEFRGSSHDRITYEIYKRSGGNPR